MKITGTVQQAPVASTTGDRPTDGAWNFAAKFNQSIRENGSNQAKREDIWGDVTEQYNVRNITFEELSEVAHKLYEAGEISFKEVALLTFNPARHPTNPIKNYFITKADNQGRRDWIAEYEARLDRNIKLGNTLGATRTRELLGILQRLV